MPQFRFWGVWLNKRGPKVSEGRSLKITFLLGAVGALWSVCSTMQPEVPNLPVEAQAR